MRLSFRGIRGFDLLIMMPVILLAIIGIASIYSVGLSNVDTKMVFFYKQALFFVISILFMMFLASIDYRFLKSYYKIFLILSLIFLSLVFVFGRNIRGANAWIPVLGFQFQPVEFAKIALVIFLATYLSKRAKDFIYSWKPVFVSALVMFAMVGLVLLQPDMGSAIILFSIWFFMILFTNVDKKKIIIMVSVILGLLVFAWFGFFENYQKERIVTFLMPSKDPLGVGYNLTQAVTAVGSGQFFGRGFGLGSQSQLNFLPEQWTDFIYAVISEEFGFFGSSLVIALILIFLLRISYLIKNSNDNFAIFLCLGFLIMFFTQSFMNIAMNVGMAPVIGVPLPFVSYGGSSLIMSFLAIGILESIVIHRVEY